MDSISSSQKKIDTRVLMWFAGPPTIDLLSTLVSQEWDFLYRQILTKNSSREIALCWQEHTMWKEIWAIYQLSTYILFVLFFMIKEKVGQNSYF